MRRAGPLLVLAALGLATAGCDRLPLFCRDSLVEGALSPDASRVAEVVVRDCSRTTGYTTHLTLRSMREQGRGPTVAVFSGARPPTLKWRGSQRLLVSPDAGSKVLYQKPRWDGVDLEYRPPSRESKSEGTP